MCIIIVRLDLDRYDLLMIERLVVDGVVGLAEAKDSHAYLQMGEVARLMWVRRMQRDRDELARSGVSA